MLFTRFCCALVSLTLSASSYAQKKDVAPTPPMGWNSWDAYGLTIDESDFRANVQVLAGLRDYGWQYAVIDEGWYMRNPDGKDLAARDYLYDANGLLEPVEARFPSAANNAGFKPLADWVHSLGLKFGIHIIRGIPKQVVKENLPIAGSSFHAADAADTSETCPWDDANYGVSDTPAGQAYYDSMLKQYAQWGLDFIKVDCISDHPYRPTEIRQIAESIRKTGRPILLSLSPGPTNLSHAAEVAKYAEMWRISDDHWDAWKFDHEKGEFPFSVRDAFDRLAEWNPYVKPNSWPDEDMLPEGSLTPHPGWGPPRPSRLTPEEQRTEFTLWAVSRSPLIYGGNLIKLHEFNRGLMTSRELIDINQKAIESHPVLDLPTGFENARVWTATVGIGHDRHLYCAFFNLDDKQATLHADWKGLHLPAGKHAAVNIDGGTAAAASDIIDVSLPAHGSAVYRIQ